MRIQAWNVVPDAGNAARPALTALHDHRAFSHSCPPGDGTLVCIRTLTRRLLHSAHPFLDFRCALRRFVGAAAADGSFIGESGSILDGWARGIAAVGWRDGWN